MAIVSCLINILMHLINQVDKIISFFGIRFLPLTRGSILKGLPEGAAEELEKPDIKLQADTIFQVPITKPVFIIGPARTGTTFLQWLLACDKQFRSPLLYEQMCPLPPRPVKDYTEDERYKRAKALIDLMKFLNPVQYAVHPTEPDKPEECLLLFQKSFLQVSFIGSSASFTNAVLDCDRSHARDIYEYFKLQLQILGWGQDMESRCYLGKSPMHLFNLDTLVEVFPDARLIYTFRPLDQMVASTLSLFKYIADPTGFDTSSNEWKKTMMRLLDRQINGGLKSLLEIEANNPGVKVRVLPYTDLTSNPLGEIRKLYDFLEMNLTPEAEAAMVSYLENDPKKKVYSKHVYKKGVHLPRGVLEEEFKFYINEMSKRVKKKDLVL